MTARHRRVAKLEAESVAVLPLAPDLETLVSRYADRSGIPADEIRTEARRIATITHGMTLDEQIAWCAADAGCTVTEFRRDMEALLA